MARRLILAFLISPAVVPVGVTVWALASNIRVPESFVLGAMYAAFTYGAAVLLGMPSFYAFTRRGWTNWWHYALAGGAIGVTVLAGICAAAGQSFFQFRIVLLFSGIGVLSTTVFWAIAFAPARRRRRLAG